MVGHPEVEPPHPAPKSVIYSSSGLLATNLPLLSRRLQLSVPLRVDLLLSRGEHVPRRDVARGAVQADVVVVVHVSTADGALYYPHCPSILAICFHHMAREEISGDESEDPMILPLVVWYSNREIATSVKRERVLATGHKTCTQECAHGTHECARHIGGYLVCRPAPG